MGENHEQLDARLTALEQRLAAIEARLTGLKAGGTRPVASEAIVHEAREAAPSREHAVPATGNGERWLQRLGIALLLIGLAFLFKYAVDREWITPWVRVSIGLVTAALLIGLGFRLPGRRLMLARTLVGGGLACFYISLFAAFQLYHLLDLKAAFAGMALATAGGFVISLGRIGAPMAAVAAIGGFATPFVLYTGHENVPALLLYALLLVLGSLGIYLRHLWRPLLWITVAGGWLVLASAYFSAGYHVGLPEDGGVRALRSACVVFWLIFALLPLRGLRAGDTRGEGLLVITTPLLGLAFAEHLWLLDKSQWAAVWMLAGLLYGGGAYLWRVRQSLLAWLHLLMAMLLFTIGLWHVLGQGLLLLSVAAELVAILMLARRLQSERVQNLVHILYSGVLYLLLIRLLFPHAGDTPFANPKAMTDLAILVLTLGVARLSKQGGGAVYLVAAYVGLLLLIRRELSFIANGEAWVSVLWAVAGALLLLVSTRRRHHGMRKVAFATLMLVAAKLLLVDLQRIEALWRILISVGIGGLFLLLSYLLPGQASPEEGAVQEE